MKLNIYTKIRQSGCSIWCS